MKEFFLLSNFVTKENIHLFIAVKTQAYVPQDFLTFGKDIIKFYHRKFTMKYQIKEHVNQKQFILIGTNHNPSETQCCSFFDPTQTSTGINNKINNRQGVSASEKIMEQSFKSHLN